MIAWFDTHCHPYMTETSVAAQLERARAAGVDQILIVGVDLDSSERAIELALIHEGAYAAVGIHPNDAAEAPLDAIRDLAAHPKVVAVGETGIDLYRDSVPLKEQESAFRGQIEIAKDAGKTLVIHGRDAHPEVKRILADQGPPEHFVMHCFSGSFDDGCDYIALGAVLSFAGPVTFANAGGLREAAAALPLESIVIETDAPFLSPHPFRGKPNEPARVALVGEAIAELKGIDVEMAAEVTTANARRLFGLPA